VKRDDIEFALITSARSLADLYVPPHKTALKSVDFSDPVFEMVRRHGAILEFEAAPQRFLNTMPRRTNTEPAAISMKPAV
jgi:hypothetical protein